MFMIISLILHLYQYPGVHASDADTGINGEVVYSLIGAYANWFDLDPIWGLLEVSEDGAVALDREMMSSVELQVRLMTEMHWARKYSCNQMLKMSELPIFIF